MLEQPTTAAVIDNVVAFPEFAGATIEIFNDREGYRYHGCVKSISRQADCLIIECDWLTKIEGKNSISDYSLIYEIDLDLYTMRIDNAQIVLYSGLSGERAIIAKVVSSQA